MASDVTPAAEPNPSGCTSAHNLTHRPTKICLGIIRLFLTSYSAALTSFPPFLLSDKTAYIRPQVEAWGCALLVQHLLLAEISP
jgi:hypothetical protein